MGWEEGRGLGKNEDGIIEPVMPSLKFDTKGLAAASEGKAKSLPQKLLRKAEGALGKNPVSMLQEYCQQKKYPIPEYLAVDDSGPDHKRKFAFKVNINNIWYQPTISCSTKKLAKALAASVACQAFNLLPKDLGQNNFV